MAEAFDLDTLIDKAKNFVGNAASGQAQSAQPMSETSPALEKAYEKTLNSPEAQAIINGSADKSAEPKINFNANEASGSEQRTDPNESEQIRKLRPDLFKSETDTSAKSAGPMSEAVPGLDINNLPEGVKAILAKTDSPDVMGKVNNAIETGRQILEGTASGKSSNGPMSEAVPGLDINNLPEGVNAILNKAGSGSLDHLQDHVRGAMETGKEILAKSNDTLKTANMESLTNALGGAAQQLGGFLGK